MVVVALIAVATASAVLSLRDSASTALERDAQRLAAVLEAARAQARANDAAVFWHSSDRGYVLRSPSRPEVQQAWLSEHTRAGSSAPVQLGPEPLMAPQRIELFSALSPQRRVWVVTDGLRPFAVQVSDAPARP